MEDVDAKERKPRSLRYRLIRGVLSLDHILEVILRALERAKRIVVVVSSTVVVLLVIVTTMAPKLRDGLYAIINIQTRYWENVTDKQGPFDPRCAYHMVFADDRTPEWAASIKLTKDMRLVPTFVSQDVLYVLNPAGVRLAITKEEKSVFLVGDDRFAGNVEENC